MTSGTVAAQPGVVAWAEVGTGIMPEPRNSPSRPARNMPTWPAW